MVVALNTKRTRCSGGVKQRSNIQQRFSPVKQLLLPPKLAWQLQVFLQQQLYRPKNDNAMLQKTREYYQCYLREFFGAASDLQKVALFTDLTVNEGRFLKRGLRGKEWTYKHGGGLLFIRIARRLPKRQSHHTLAKTPPPPRYELSIR